MPILTADAEETLLDFLRRHLPEWKTTTIRQRLKHGLVRRNGEIAVAASTILSPGDSVEVLHLPPRPEFSFPAGLGPPPVPILFADAALLAVDKPSGLLSVASEWEKQLTAVRLLRDWLAGLEREGERELHAAHRLDRDASGVLLLTRSLAMKRSLAAVWSTFEKTYLALADGVPDAPEGDIDVPLWEDKGLFVRTTEPGRGEKARTSYRVLKTRGRRSLLEVKLGGTGRKHQIRVHLAHIGCPIVGDSRYGVSKGARLGLHASVLKITRPDDGRELVVRAATPDWFQRVLRQKT